MDTRLFRKINLPPTLGETHFAYPFAEQDADICCHLGIFGLVFTLDLAHTLSGGNMKLLWLTLLVAPVSIQAQTSTTNTDCNASGSTINCTSRTTDNSEAQRQSYEAGQKIGASMGAGLAAAMNSHSQNSWVKKYCMRNPGASWEWRRNSDHVLLASGRCPTFSDRTDYATSEFLARHKDVMRGPSNTATLAAYIDEHRLNPSEEKSYERAYKELKRLGKLALYAN